MVILEAAFVFRGWNCGIFHHAAILIGGVWHFDVSGFRNRNRVYYCASDFVWRFRLRMAFYGVYCYIFGRHTAILYWNIRILSCKNLS